MIPVKYDAVTELRLFKLDRLRERLWFGQLQIIFFYIQIIPRSIIIIKTQFVTFINLTNNIYIYFIINWFHLKKLLLILYIQSFFKNIVFREKYSIFKWNV